MSPENRLLDLPATGAAEADPGAVYQRSLKVRIRNVGGSLILSGDHQQVQLEPEAARLWRALDGVTPFDEIHRRLAVGARPEEDGWTRARDVLTKLVAAEAVAVAPTDQAAAARPLLVGDLGEKEFIATVLGRFAETAAQDRFEDCVVIELDAQGSDQTVLLLNVDHPSYIRPRLAEPADYRFYGRWVAAATCSDVISMGVRPVGFCLDLAMPMQLPVSAVEALYEGMTDLLASYGAVLRGGNVDNNALELVGVAWGIGRRDGLVRRVGARVGDLVVATCELGRGWSRQLILDREAADSVPEDLWAESSRYADTVRTPMEPILECAEAGLFSSGMDLSDGVLEYCHTIAQRNGLGVQVTEDTLGGHPLVQRAAELVGVRPGLLALEPGYDFPYAHGYTVAAKDLAEVRAIFARHRSRLSVVGEVTEAPGVTLRRRDGEQLALPQYWSDQVDTGSDRMGRWFEMARNL